MTRTRSVAWATSPLFADGAAAMSTTGCEPQQGFYLRRDKLDVSIYNRSIDASAAEGAAISFTGDRENDTDTAEIHALAAWVFARNPCSPIGEPPIGRPYISGYAFATSVLANGTLTADETDEKSALKPGLDAQVEIANAFFELQTLTATPYYQTDFRGEAQAYGFSASWQPYPLDWFLGGTYRQFSPLFNFFYQLKAEADGLRVNDPGLTDLSADTDYLCDAPGLSVAQPAWRSAALGHILCLFRRRKFEPKHAPKHPSFHHQPRLQFYEGREDLDLGRVSEWN